MLLDVHLLLLLLWWRRGQTCVHFWVYFKVRVKIVSGAVDLLYPLFFSTLQPTDRNQCNCSGSNERPMAHLTQVWTSRLERPVCVCVLCSNVQQSVLAGYGQNSGCQHGREAKKAARCAGACRAALKGSV